MVAKDESAVLRELKETIRKQNDMIETLRNRLSSEHPPAVGAIPSGGHAPQRKMEDELEEYLTKSFLHVARHRVGWLSLFLCSLSMTALIMNGFEHILSQQLELAYFVPLLAGHGGNTGGQTVGTILSALSAGTISLQDAPRVVAKEALSGLATGIMLGSIVSSTAFFVMGISPHVTTVLFCALPLVSTLAATLGSTIPFICVALGLDPSVIAAPAMTSFVDVTGLLSYFLIATIVFHFFGLEL